VGREREYALRFSVCNHNDYRINTNSDHDENTLQFLVKHQFGGYVTFIALQQNPIVIVTTRHEIYLYIYIYILLELVS
jgi:hypothetical protein